MNARLTVLVAGGQSRRLCHPIWLEYGGFRRLDDGISRLCGLPLVTSGRSPEHMVTVFAQPSGGMARDLPLNRNYRIG